MTIDSTCRRVTPQTTESKRWRSSMQKQVWRPRPEPAMHLEADLDVGDVVPVPGGRKHGVGKAQHLLAHRTCQIWH